MPNSTSPAWAGDGFHRPPGPAVVEPGTVGAVSAPADQICSGTSVIAPQGYSATHTPQPLQ